MSITNINRLKKIGFLLGFFVMLSLGILIKLTFEGSVTQKKADQPAPIVKTEETSTPTSEEAKEDAAVDESLFTVSKAAEAVFRAFPASDAICYDDKTHIFFFHFSVSASNFGDDGANGWKYQAGWNIVDRYDFIMLGNHTAALKMANPLPIGIDPHGLNCVDKTDTK